MRADARKNYDRLLAVAHHVVIKHGADASMRLSPAGPKSG